MTPADLSALVQQVASTYNLPQNLLTAQIQHESGGDPFAFRYEHSYFQAYIQNKPAAKAALYGPLAACSYGLLQILLETAYEIGYTDRPEGLFVPRVGLAFGAKQMRKLWDHFGGAPESYRLALAAYNAGEGNIAAGQSYASAVIALSEKTDGH